MMTRLLALWLALTASAFADDSEPDTSAPGPQTVREALLVAKARAESDLCYLPLEDGRIQLGMDAGDTLLVGGVGDTLEDALKALPEYVDRDPMTVPPCKPDEED